MLEKDLFLEDYLETLRLCRLGGDLHVAVRDASTMDGPMGLQRGQVGMLARHPRLSVHARGRQRCLLVDPVEMYMGARTRQLKCPKFS